MTDEVKTCDCKEKCCKKVKEFLFIAGAVFVGATLAILLCNAITRPKMPPMPNQMPPAFGQNMQGQPPMMMPPQGNWGKMDSQPTPRRGHGKHFEKPKFDDDNFQGRPDFGPQKPENMAMPVKK